jgi:carbon-monoxide dehydrogenase small subunit/xanthine dehydrogenase small subunit
MSGHEQQRDSQQSRLDPRQVIERHWFLNGEWRRLRVEPLKPLLHILREDLGITGPKEGCGEGECGACTVLLNSNPVPACVVAAGQVADGSRILTIEGISDTALGRTISESLVAHGAVQCGACTPGIVVSTYALLRNGNKPTPQEAREAISGNLCRCTGYTKIIDAILAAAESSSQDTAAPENLSQDAAAPEELSQDTAAPEQLPRHAGGFCAPETLAEALMLRAQAPGCVILAGGTDLMVRWNALHARIPAGDTARAGAASNDNRTVLYLGEIDELDGIRATGNDLRIGAITTVEAIAHDPTINHLAPALAQAARSLGARQIRHRATIGGNIANASPAADLVPPLVAADASLVLVSQNKRREIPITGFFRSYKELDLTADEILTEIRLPGLSEDKREGFHKLGTRQAQSIAKVSVAIRLLVRSGKITEIAIAAGSVAPTVVRLVKTEAQLRGRGLSHETLTAARRWVSQEISPISDVRSTSDYRRAMTGVLVADLLRELRGLR